MHLITDTTRSKPPPGITRALQTIQRLAGEGRTGRLRWALWVNPDDDLPIIRGLTFRYANRLEIVFWAIGTLLQAAVPAGILYSVHKFYPNLFAYAVPLIAAVFTYHRVSVWRELGFERALKQYADGKLDAAERVFASLLKRPGRRCPKTLLYPLLAGIERRRGRVDDALRYVQLQIDALRKPSTEVEARLLDDGIASRIRLLLDSGRADIAVQEMGDLPSPDTDDPDRNLTYFTLRLRCALHQNTPDPASTKALDDLLSEFLALPDPLKPLAAPMTVLAEAYERAGNSNRSRFWKEQLRLRTT